MFLSLQAHRIQELWVHGSFHSHFRGRPERLGNVPLRRKVIELKMQGRLQEAGDARNEELLPREAVSSQQSQSEKLCGKQHTRPQEWGHPRLLELISCHGVIGFNVCHA